MILLFIGVHLNLYMNSKLEKSCLLEWFRTEVTEISEINWVSNLEQKLVSIAIEWLKFLSLN